MLNITNQDNMKLMARYEDNYFDLAIVDPPYGINFGEFNRTNKDSNGNRYKLINTSKVNGIIKYHPTTILLSYKE